MIAVRIRTQETVSVSGDIRVRIPVDEDAIAEHLLKRMEAMGRYAAQSYRVLRKATRSPRTHYRSWDRPRRSKSPTGW